MLSLCLTKPQIQKKTRKSYHTDLKFAVYLNLIPDSMKAQIPKSTRHGFKNTDFDKIFGMGFTSSFKENLKLHKLLEKHKRIFKIFKGFIRIQNIIIKVNKAIKNKVKELDIKSMIIDSIEKVKINIPLKRILYHFKISAAKYYVWLKQVRSKCLDSSLGKCLRRWPNQLTQKEVKKMKELLTSKEYKGWPVKSIAWHAIDNNIITASSSTWYKYAPVLGINLTLPKNRRKKQTTGIRAEKPHKIWHCDVTIFRPNNNVKCYVYILMDNFSRYILSWKVDLKLSGKICFANIKEAYKKYILPNKKLRENTNLLMDGGPENENHHVDDFLSQKKIPIQKIIAQRDIVFSNSMVEAVNKLVKYRYLFHHDIPDFNALVKHLNNFIPIYNNIRPHGSHELNGLTPYQRLNGITRNYDKLKEQFRKAHEIRVLENRKANCGVC